MNVYDLVSSDWVMGQSGIAERIPLFRETVYYARFGSDEFQHPFRLVVLTNPSHDTAVWYYPL